MLPHPTSTSAPCEAGAVMWHRAVFLQAPKMRDRDVRRRALARGLHRRAGACTVGPLPFRRSLVTVGECVAERFGLTFSGSVAVAQRGA